MTDLNSPSPPAADVRQALVADIQQLLERENTFPQTIAEAARTDSYWGSQAQRLIDTVGSAAAVESLDGRPHIDESFDWSGIDPGDRERVDAVVRLIASESPVPPADGKPSLFEIVGLDKLRPRLPWCDLEYQTIAWRILSALALDPARPLDRRIKPERLAAAIMWVALTGSGGLRLRRRFKARDLWEWFDVSSCKRVGMELADQLRRCNATQGADVEVDLRDDQYAIAELTLGDHRLLHSSFRLTLMEHSHEILEQIEHQHRTAADAHPIMADLSEGKFGLRSRPVTVRWAMRGEADDSGRAYVSVALGESVDDLELLGLSVPDARRLIDALQVALNSPVAA